MAHPPEYSAEKARQGTIILRSPARKWIFFGRLVAFVALVIAFSVFAGPAVP